MKVAALKTAGHGCLVCELPVGQRQAVNAAIWDGGDQRVRGYIAAGLRMYAAQTGRSLDRKVVTRHAEHTEASWHDTAGSGAMPASANEVPVFDSSYEAITEKAANLGAEALDAIRGKLHKGTLADRELVSLAKMGVGARQAQETNRLRSRQPQIAVAAIFGIVSGHLRELPEHEVIDVTPSTAELLDVVHAERLALTALARAQAPADDADLDALLG